MKNTLFALKKLRYLPLPHLLNRKITIARIIDVNTAVLRELNAELAKRCQLQDSHRQMALLLSKYGFLDLTFTAPAEFLPRNQRSLKSVLRDLNLIGSGAKKTDRACLDTVAEGIQEGRCWLRLFLFGEPATDALKRVFEEYRRSTAPRAVTSFESTTFRVEKTVSRLADCVDQRLPITFSIQDACFTNSDAIWLATHGYF